jgi:hypothetical protein
VIVLVIPCGIMPSVGDRFSHALKNSLVKKI